MCATVIGIVRSADGLHALTYEAGDPSDHPWQRAQTYALRPLAESSKPELWTAWRALASVSEWNDAALGDVLAVLRHTVPSLDVPRDLPALGAEVHAPPEPRATAAHPRAFRGTKYRPPKPPQPEPVDVRPYLLTRRHTDHLMEQLGQPRGIDPYAAWNHGVNAVTFDPAFVTYLLPMFRGCAWSEIGAFAAVARTLELHASPEVRAALVGVYVAADDPVLALGWWTHVLAHPAEQRVETAQLISASGVARLPAPDAAFAADIARLTAVQQWCVYRGLACGAAPAYILSGIALDAMAPLKIEDVPPGKADVTTLVDATTARLTKAMEEDSGADFWRVHLWRLCGYQPELIELLGSAQFSELDPEAAFWLIRVASSPRWSPETAEQEWRELARILPLLVEFAARLRSEYQRKFVEMMGEIYWSAVDDDHCVTHALAKAVDYCFRLSKPPFVTDAVIAMVMPCMALVHEDGLQSWSDRKALCAAPDASWRVLEEACRRRNDAHMLRCGLNRLERFAPTLMVSTFATTPSALLQTADLLATISFESAKRVLVEYAMSPLADPALANATLERLCELVAPIARAGGPNPIRRALRRHLAGEVGLSDAQLRGHRERIVAELDVVRLAAIRQAVERVLAARVGIETIETPTVRHAIAMLANVDVHRRQLRRMITATLAGDRTWRLRHPRTIEWFARHPKLDAAVWIDGIETRGEIAGIGEVRIAVEKDALEALKLGTYVGSCLGRGGNLEYSAAAIVLDVNKHVVYARDARGTVIGRQVVAISEAEQLVCFAVYSTAKRELLEPLFRDHDRAFAAKLALPLCSDDYEIVSILSREWWDDSAWEV
jgi:hypothetical protein